MEIAFNHYSGNSLLRSPLPVSMLTAVNHAYALN